MFCNEFWFGRCNVMHDEEDQKKQLTQWHGNVLDKMMNGEREGRRFAESTKLEIDQDPNENIRSWILGALKIKRKLKKCP